MMQQQQQQQQPIDPATPIPVTLKAIEWDQVLNVLGEAPFKVVAALIQKIIEQAQSAGGQLVPANGAGDQHPPLMNGALPG